MRAAAQRPFGLGRARSCLTAICHIAREYRAGAQKGMIA
jgi:hypothetical protein